MQIERVKQEELVNLIHKNRVLIFDCRDDDFNGGNIVGSINTPDAYFEEQFFDLAMANTKAQSDKASNIVVVFHCMESVCRGPRCAKLFKKALPDVCVKILHGGFDQWVRRFWNTDLVENYDDKYWGYAEFPPKQNLSDQKLCVVSLLDYPFYIPQVAEWLFGEWPDENIGLGIRSVKEMIHELRNPEEGEFTLIALENFTMVGTISLLNDDLKGCNLSPWVGDLYVHKHYRNKGIASKLLQSILEKVEDRVVYLNCLPHLKRIYEQRGFHEIERMNGKLILEKPRLCDIIKLKRFTWISFLVLTFLWSR